jgi:hypothetical protein
MDSRTLLLIGDAFSIAFFILFFSLVWRSIFQSYFAYTHWEKSPATITGLTGTDGLIGMVFSDFTPGLCTYTINIEGKEILGMSSLPMQMSSRSLQVGSQITVLLNPRAPHKSIVYGTRWGAYRTLAIIMFFFTLLIAFGIVMQIRDIFFH